MTRYCACPGYEHHDHDDTSGTCLNRAIEESGLCSGCDVQRYVAIGRAAVRLFVLLQDRGTRNE